MSRFDNETFDVILQRQLDRVDDSFDKRQGSHVYNMLAPAAAEIAQLYIALDNVLNFGFASEDMPREYLELRAAEYGIAPTVAQKAVGQLTFTGDDNTDIPSGTRVRTDDNEDPVYAVTTEAGTITGGTVTVSAEAEDAGADGNVSSGNFIVVTGDLAGVVEVGNTDSFEGGTDDETDESLLARFFSRVQEPATSGNIAQYRQWAASRNGVNKARVFPLHSGPGTVKILLISDDYRAPDSVIVNDVQDYIDPNINGDGSGEAPIGAAATVQAVTEVGVNVTADVTVASGSTIEQVTEEFEEGLSDYLAELVEDDDSLVRYTQVISVLLGIPRVVDFDNLTVNGGTNNVEVTNEEVPTVGTVTFNATV